MDYLPLNQNGGIKKMLSGLEKVRVMICFDDYSLIGQTYYQAEQRFIDVLNKDFVIDKQRVRDFLIVTQALLINRGGEKEQVQAPCFVSKASIMFIGTFDETRSTTSENINKVKVYPWREKSAMPIKMFLGGKYKLVGQIHGDPDVLPVHYIESQGRFLPVTGVRAVSQVEPSEISFDFAAVNRDYISLFQLS